MADIKRCFSVISDESTNVLLKVAFATDDNRLVNQHFGSARAFSIYGINADSIRMLSMAEFGSSEKPDNEDKLASKLEWLDGCIAVYCKACGASAVKQLLEKNIQPLKVIEDSPIKELVKSFQHELSSGPSNWLATAIKRQQTTDGFYTNYEIES